MHFARPFFQSLLLRFAGGLAVVLALGFGVADRALSQSVSKGTAERVAVYGRSLEGNLSGDSATRNVSVYLPPSYASQPSRHYPLVVMLHGYTSTDTRWFGRDDNWFSIANLADNAIAAGAAKEMIVVVPDAYTKFAGSMYSNSVVTGNWEDFIAEDLVAYMDANYRTIPEVASRGLSGHSMGGYGAARIGMMRPDVFSSIYMQSPCCMPARAVRSSDGPSDAEQVKTMDDFNAASFGTKATIASAAAWAPNPNNPPFYFDLPTKNGEPQHDVLGKFHANAPLSMIDQHVPKLRSLTAIALDAGDRDTGIAAASRVLHQMLNDYGIDHVFEIYNGDHTNRIGERIEHNVLPFFTKHLADED